MDTLFIPESLRNKVFAAMERPYLWPEIEALQTRQQALAQKYILGKVTKKTFGKELKKIQSASPSVLVSSLPELEAVMNLLDLDEGVKRGTLADLSLKHDRAVNSGYRCRFSIWFYRSVSGAIAFYCGVQIDIK